MLDPSYAITVCSSRGAQSHRDVFSTSTPQHPVTLAVENSPPTALLLQPKIRSVFTEKARLQLQVWCYSPFQWGPGRLWA